jgi:hypothetical protein
VGRTNVEAAIRHLSETDTLRFNAFNDVTLIGSSAGALGALLNAPYIENFLSADSKKSLIADSPGLHFGDHFWKQIGDPFTKDLFAHLRVFGIEPRDEDTNVAKFLPQICDVLKNWNVGFLQGSRDIVMSGLFGAISPREHEKLVYGDEGLWKGTEQEGDNCAAWIPSTEMHTFLLLPGLSNWNVKGVTAMDFARKIVDGRPVQNVSDRH